MMSRYINADKLQYKLAEIFGTLNPRLLDPQWLVGIEICQVRLKIKNFVDKNATADVQEVRHGRWIGYTSTAFRGMDKIGNPIYRDVNVWQCPECYRKTVVKENYCPNCGAKMEEE